MHGHYKTQNFFILPSENIYTQANNNKTRNHTENFLRCDTVFSGRSLPTVLPPSALATWRHSFVVITIRTLNLTES
jgi:hypothetical protein